MSAKMHSNVTIRYPLLDLLRWLLATYVFSFHAWGLRKGWDSQDVLSSILQYGYLSVDVFFIISGLVISLSLSTSSNIFVLKRAKRLIPPLIASAIINACFGLYLLLKNGGSSFETLSIAVKNILPITSEPSKLQNYVVWSIIIEAQFYLLVFIYLRLNQKFKELDYLRFMQGWLFICYLNAYIPLGPVGEILILEFAPYFIFGSILASKFLNPKKNISTMTWIVLIPILYNTAHSRALLHEGPGNGQLGVLILCLGICVIFLSTKQIRFSQKFNSISQHLGEGSYFAYLIFGYFGLGIIDQFNLIFATKVAFVVSYVGCAVISILYTTKIHKKLSNFLIPGRNLKP